MPAGWPRPVAAARTIDVERLPLSAALRGAVGAERRARLALTGGDDYELCFTVPAARRRWNWRRGWQMSNAR